MKCPGCVVGGADCNYGIIVRGGFGEMGHLIDTEWRVRKESRFPMGGIMGDDP